MNPARRNSTILNPRSYVAEELSKQAPIFTGSTKFEQLHDARNILVTGGAGFMYVDSTLVDV
jgi:dTDP-glucose 4,6-dehydratase